MTSEGKPAADDAHDSVLARVRALTAGIRERAAAAEEARCTLVRKRIAKVVRQSC